MLIIGCDYHPSFQQIALVDTETGELDERRLVHREQAEQFYGELRDQGVKAQTIHESEMALFFECIRSCTQNVLDTADIVRDRDVMSIEIWFGAQHFNGNGRRMARSSNLERPAPLLNRKSKRQRFTARAQSCGHK